MVHVIRVLTIATAFLMLGPARPSQAQTFQGDVVATWLRDGRQMELVKSFAFVDSRGRKWPVPKGAKVDGASIPRVLWSAIGSPYLGKYRRASVVHDYYCDTMSRPWKEVHEKRRGRKEMGKSYRS
ncbi:MAG: DUF1353 domain-containing protein [Hyphomicrobiaceae bacterium]